MDHHAALCLGATLLVCPTAALTGQRDVLSPFRHPQHTVAIPDRMTEVFRLLRIMQSTAENLGPVSTDENGREVCDHPRWRAAYEELEGHYVDPGVLAEVLRSSASVADRDAALYGAFYVDDPEYVLDLIEHIPGEPVSQLRSKNYPRAINYLRVQLPRTFGDLTTEEYAALDRPAVGSPVANSMGITREPGPEEHLYHLDLRPFVQLLEEESPIDQAQALWFLKECMWIQSEMAEVWMERLTPRLRLLLDSGDQRVRTEALGVVEAADPEHRKPPAGTDLLERSRAWLDDVLYQLYPPIRVVSPGLVELHPSEDLDRVVAVGTELLERDGIGSVRNGQTRDGAHYRGLWIGRAPPPLDRLGLPVGAVITNVNGQPVNSSTQLLQTIRVELQHKLHFLVEYVQDGTLQAIEFRVRK